MHSRQLMDQSCLSHLDRRSSVSNIVGQCHAAAAAKSTAAIEWCAVGGPGTGGPRYFMLHYEMTLMPATVD